MSGEGHRVERKPAPGWEAEPSVRPAPAGGVKRRGLAWVAQTLPCRVNPSERTPCARSLSPPRAHLRARRRRKAGPQPPGHPPARPLSLDQALGPRRAPNTSSQSAALGAAVRPHMPPSPPGQEDAHAWGHAPAPQASGAMAPGLQHERGCPGRGGGGWVDRAGKRGGRDPAVGFGSSCARPPRRPPQHARL